MTIDFLMVFLIDLEYIFKNICIKYSQGWVTKFKKRYDIGKCSSRIQVCIMRNC